MSGYVQIHRQILEDTAFRSDAESMAFAWMVLRASWKPTQVRYKDRSISLNRGDFAMSVRDMAERLDRSKDWAKRFLDRLAARDMIKITSATGVNIITICNYDKYQAEIETTATGPRQSVRQDRDRTATQNKEGKKGIRDTNVSQGAGDNSAKQKARSRNFDPDTFPVPDAIPRQDWDAFIEMRKAIGKPIKTENGAFGLVEKLRELAEDGHPPGRVLRQSIAFEWQGLFPLKDQGNRNGNGSNGTPTPKPGTTGEAARRIRERLAAQERSQDELFGIADGEGQRLALPAS